MPLRGAPGSPAAPEIPLPPEPQSIEQTGLTSSFIADLALKTLYLRGQMTMAELSTALGLPITNVIDKVMEFLKGERLVRDPRRERALRRELPVRHRRSRIREGPGRPWPAASTSARRPCPCRPTSTR